MEERQLVKPQNHRLVINNRKTGSGDGYEEGREQASEDTGKD